MELPRRERGDNMLPPGELTDIRRRLRLIAGKHDKVEEVWRLNKEFGHRRTFGWGIRLRFGRVKQLERPPTSLIPMRGIRGEVAAHDLVQLDIHIMRMAVPGDL